MSKLSIASKLFDINEMSQKMATNEPNMIINPQKYMDSEGRTFEEIALNIMAEHIIHDTLTQDRRRSIYLLIHII